MRACVCVCVCVCESAPTIPLLTGHVKITDRATKRLLPRTDVPISVRARARVSHVTLIFILAPGTRNASRLFFLCLKTHTHTHSRGRLNCVLAQFLQPLGPCCWRCTDAAEWPVQCFVSCASSTCVRVCLCLCV